MGLLVIFAKWILRKAFAKEKLLAEYRPFSNFDKTDEESYWRDMLKWADNPEARKWAYEELNRLNERLIFVEKGNEFMFWHIQGAIGEMHRFIKMPDYIEAKLKSLIAEKAPAKKEDGPISEKYTS